MRKGTGPHVWIFDVFLTVEVNGNTGRCNDKMLEHGESLLYFSMAVYGERICFIKMCSLTRVLSDFRALTSLCLKRETLAQLFSSP